MEEESEKEVDNKEAEAEDAAPDLCVRTDGALLDASALFLFLRLILLLCDLLLWDDEIEGAVTHLVLSSLGLFLLCFWVSDVVDSLPKAL